MLRQSRESGPRQEELVLHFQDDLSLYQGEKMHWQQRKYSATMVLLLLFSLSLTACNTPLVGTNNPLPTLTVEPGWETVLQTHGDTANQSEKKNQSFPLYHILPKTYLRLSVTCAGDGSVSIQVKAPTIAIATATCANTSQTSRTDVFIDSPQDPITLNLTVSGSVQ